MIEWLAVGIIAFLMFYLSSILTEQHVLLKLLTIVFGLLFIILLSKSALENKNFCDVVVQNQTVQGNTTTFNYQHYCNENVKTTSNTSFKLTLSYLALFFIYVFIYFNKEIFSWISSKLGGRL